MDYSPEQLLNIWKEGETLDDAIWEFCDSKYINEYPENHPKIGIKSNKTPDTLLDGISEVLAAYTKSKMGMDKYYAQIKTSKNNMKNNLYDKIINSKLIAIGYEMPIKSDFPILIPSHMWPPENADIDKSSISANGIDFVRVRIIKKSSFKNSKKETQKKIRIEDKPIGRPSLKCEIINAYEYLKKEGHIDYSKTLKSHTVLIQKTVQGLSPEIKDTNGMAHEAIRRAVTKRFQDDKVASKSTSKL